MFAEAEPALLRRAQMGDEAAFTQIMGRYKRPVVDFAYRMLGAPDAAADVAQEVFVRVWRAIGRYEVGKRARFSTWLFQIARNACIDVRRRRARDPLAGAVDIADAQDWVAARGGSTDEVEAREVSAQVAAAVLDLPEDQQTALVLSVYEGLSYAEIAEVMDCSVKSVELRLYRARRQLREDLAGLDGSGA